VFKKYYHLSKPGIIYGNLLTAVAGYLFASAWHIKWGTFVGLLAGLALVIAGACAWNNYLDRKLDKAMERTAKRELVTGTISGHAARLYASIMFIIGMIILVRTQNALTTILALIAFVDYVILYGWSKRKSVHGTLVGTISGSIPLIAGYTAVVNKLDVTALLLFVLMAAWQMAHFYGIALRRLKDYKAAKVPVLPAVRGVPETINQTLSYMALFVASSLALLATDALNLVTGILLLITGIVWFVPAWRHRASKKSETWGKLVFINSLLVMLVMCVCLAFGGL